MRVRIHSGATSIGNCVEIEANRTRLMLDLGRPLLAGSAEDVSPPEIAGLVEGGDTSLTGVLITHGHADHYGLAHMANKDVPVYMGEAAYRVVREGSFFLHDRFDVECAGFLRDREPMEFGPFTVMPYLTDHSAFDAYSLLVEADGRRLFYTGDIRAHGRKAAIFERLLERPPGDIDVLLMEGTHVREGARPEVTPRTERDVEDACVALCRATAGMVLVQYSPQNVDRLVTLFKTAVRAGRELVMDLYAATVAAATGRDTIPQAEWDGVRVYLPATQRRKVSEVEEFERTDRVKEARIYPEELAARPGELVMTFRQSLARELDKAHCLAGAHAIWSLWSGYLDETSGRETQRWCAERGIPITVEHASGHASIRDLQRLVEALAPDRVVPIHSFAPERYPEFFPRVEPRSDGEWWRV